MSNIEHLIENAMCLYHNENVKGFPDRDYIVSRIREDENYKALGFDKCKCTEDFANHIYDICEYMEQTYISSILEDYQIPYDKYYGYLIDEV